jgi:tetratricopeptide (TPR) repeat protein
MRQVAVWLELFHDAFARLLSKPVVNFSVPTTVVVFRDDASFRPFKPLYQGRPADVAGYFQPGPDVNYIALSLERGGRDSLRTAFHEYVHLHLRENMPDAPLWLNEGLAEFYSAFAVSGGEAAFGAPIPYHIRLLRGRELIPLATLFAVAHDSPHYNERDKSGIFYAESWALVHYLMLGGGGRLRPQLTRFVNLLSAGVSADAGVQLAFGMSLEALEGELKEYVRRGEFASERVAVGRGPDSHVSAQSAALSEAEAYSYLGDLLLHINRPGDAEKYFQRSLSLDPKLAAAHAALGLLLVRQGSFEEAKKHLRLATVTPQSYLVHYYYAYVLSQEGAGSGPARYSPESAAVMRNELGKVIKLAPQFANAYYLLAFVNLVTGEQLDEAVDLAKRAQQLDRGRPHYPLLLAQIHLGRRDVESARQILESLARQNTDPQVRSEAEALLEYIDSPSGGAAAGSPADIRARVGASVVRELGTASGDLPGATPGVKPSIATAVDGITVDNTGPMPSPDQVIEWYVEAAGGPKAVGAVTSRVARGKLDVAGVSRGGAIEIYTKAPNKVLTVMKAHPFGEVRFGHDGRAGWSQTHPGGLRALKGAESGALRRDAYFYNPASLRDNYQSIRLLGRAKIGYRDVYVLEMRPAAGDAERLYIDAKTHLPARLDAARVNVRGAGYATIYLDDWREVDGLKMPFRITQSFPGLSVVITIEEVKQNAPLDEALFNRPASR